MKAFQHLLIVASTVFVPVAACGGRVVGDETENGGSQAAATQSSSSSNTADAGPTATATTNPKYPCSSNTAAYYTDAGPPPATGGCRDLYTPSERHPTGCIMTIVAPYVPVGTCQSVECRCSASGRWEPVDPKNPYPCP